MMNAWNDLIKTEPNIAGMGGGGVGLVVQPTSNTNVNSMFDNDSNLMPSQNGPAAVAAAVATAAMMMSSSGIPQQNSYTNNSNNNRANMMLSSHVDDCNLDDDDTMDNDDDDCNSSVNNDAEGVWSPDIEQSFQEALAIYPPCGRRKIILSEEGKMYGRNELIARYIKVRTGKSRSRKQVSSHIQVLAKRKTKDFHNHLKDGKDGKLGTNGAFPNPFSHLTSAQIISPAPVPLPPQQSHLIATNSNPTQQTLMTNPNLTPNIPPVVSLNPNTNMPNTPQQLVINQRNNPNSHHQSQLLQNCTNLLPNNVNGIQSQSCIWSHPGLQPEKKARTLNMPSSSSLPCSTSSSTSSNSNEDLIASSSSSSSSSQNNENNRNINHHHTHNHHHHHGHHPHSQTQIHTNNHHSSLSPPDSLSPQNQWITNYNNNNNSIVPNKSIIGLQQLRLIEFSGFIEQRHDPELYHKHLFVHLNTSDYNLFNCFNKNDKTNDTDDFETINYKEFADKFPENDLFWSLSTNNEKPSSSSSSSSSASTSSTSNSAAYLIKFWVDLNYSLEDGISSIYAVTNIFESTEPITISCSTKVCSFGSQVVEKVETEHGRYESNGKYVYRIEGSPMCEYMITFINKLKQLPEKSLQNSVLENFSVLQLIKNHDTQELLLSLAYVFEVSTSEHGAQHVVYKLSNK